MLRFVDRALDRLVWLYESNPVGRTWMAVWYAAAYHDASKFREIRRKTEVT